MAGEGNDREGVAAPVDVVLARAVEEIAHTTGLPGGTWWEPKWDGYRLVVAVDEHGARL